MRGLAEPIRVQLEVGGKKTFATAVDWPGWARSGRDEEAAIAALAHYAARYEEVLAGAGLRTTLPSDPGGYRVVERADGDASTDFGVPGQVAGAELEPVEAHDVDRLVSLWRAAWQAFDAAAARAEGAVLARGPRGGGRDLERIRTHVDEAEQAYLTALGGKARAGDHDRVAVRELAVEAFVARVRGDLPDVGPRGGRRWPPRYAVRRSAWHALDHAWEIEDRS